jgi:hypothetical protein
MGSREPRGAPSVLEQNGSASGLLCESNFDLCGPGPELGGLPRPLASSGDPGSPSPRAQQVAKDIIAVRIGPTSRSLSPGPRRILLRIIPMKKQKAPA